MGKASHVWNLQSLSFSPLDSKWKEVDRTKRWANAPSEDGDAGPLNELIVLRIVRMKG